MNVKENKLCGGMKGHMRWVVNGSDGEATSLVKHRFDSAALSYGPLE